MNTIFSKSNFITVDLLDLCNFFISHYNLECFEVLGIDEDNSYISTDINDKGLDKNELNDMDDIMEQGYCEKSSINLILRTLCYDGFIESGDYLISN